jgi:enoyl-CoA hydratase/carnithine racemase
MGKQGPCVTDISYARDGNVGTIEMNAPPGNSYGIAFMRELDGAIQTTEHDRGCRVVVVRSALPGFFCGGADIKQFRANSPRENIEMITVAHEILSRPAQSDKVYVAEIAGHALGGGLEIALACDLRFAAHGDYQLGLPEVTLGLLPGNGGTQRLTALVGVSRVLEIMIVGSRLSPEDALRLGIVNRLFPAPELRFQTATFASELGTSATHAIGKIKRSVYDGCCASL